MPLVMPISTWRIFSKLIYVSFLNMIFLPIAKSKGESEDFDPQK